MGWIPWGKKKEPKTPREGVFTADGRSEYSVRSGGRAVTPERLASIMRQADAGSTSAMFEFFSVVEEDPHVFSVLSKRRSSVATREIKIIPADETPQAQRAAEFAKEMIFGTGTRAGITNFREAVFDLTDAIGKGFALGQLVWATENRQFAIREIRRWPQRFCVLGSPANPSDANPDEIKIQTSAGSVNGEPLEPYQWVVSVNKARSEILARAALMRSVGWFYLFKHFGFRDWAIFLEAYGQPKRIGKYPVGSDDTERNAILEAAIALGRDAAAVIPADATLQYLETATGGNGQNPFPAMIQICNAEISKAILGGTLTTEVGDTGGNRALGEVQQSEQWNLIKSDALKLAESIRRDIVRPLILFNLGADLPIPRVEFVFEQHEDLLSKAQREEILFKNLGLPVEKSYLYQSFGVPEPAGESDALLQVPQVAAPVEADEGEENEGDEVAATDRALSHASDLIRALAEKKKIRQRSAVWAKPTR